MKMKIATNTFGDRNALLGLLSGNGIKSAKGYNPDFGPDDDGKSFGAGFSVAVVDDNGWDVSKDKSEANLSYPKDIEKILNELKSS